MTLNQDHFQVKKKVTSDLKHPTILHEDNHLLIVNKPSGLLVQGDQSGDWTLKDWAEKEKMAQDFVFTEELTEAICVKLIQSLSDNKVDVNKPIFQKYLPFLNETIKSYIMGVKGYTHPLQEFVDKIMIESAIDKQVEINYNVLDIKTIKRILKDIYGKK